MVLRVLAVQVDRVVVALEMDIASHTDVLAIELRWVGEQLDQRDAIERAVAVALRHVAVERYAVLRFGGGNQGTEHGEQRESHQHGVRPAHHEGRGDRVAPPPSITTLMSSSVPAAASAQIVAFIVAE